jgi:hypothetical protein
MNISIMYIFFIFLQFPTSYTTIISSELHSSAPSMDVQIRIKAQVWYRQKHDVKFVILSTANG